MPPPKPALESFGQPFRAAWLRAMTGAQMPTPLVFDREAGRPHHRDFDDRAGTAAGRWSSRSSRCRGRWWGAQLLGREARGYSPGSPPPTPPRRPPGTRTGLPTTMRTLTLDMLPIPLTFSLLVSTVCSAICTQMPGIRVSMPSRTECLYLPWTAIASVCRVRQHCVSLNLPNREPPRWSGAVPAGRTIARACNGSCGVPQSGHGGAIRLGSLYSAAAFGRYRDSARHIPSVPSAPACKGDYKSFTADVVVCRYEP